LEDSRLEIRDPRASTLASTSTGATGTFARFPRRSGLLINLAALAVAAFFSYIALSDIKPGRVWQALRTSDYIWLVPAVAAFAVGVAARALRWRSLFAAGRRPPPGTVLNATIIGYLFNSILPARAGEAARVVVLTQRSSISPVEIVATVVLERIYDIVAILVIFFVAEPWLPRVSWFGTAALAAIVLAGGVVAAVTALAFYGDRPVLLLLRPLRRFSLFSGSRLQQTVEEVIHGCRPSSGPSQPGWHRRCAPT
jgi:uncharacterized protein (TIRG00374 family)